MKLIWTVPADEDADAIFARIYSENKEAALRVHDAIYDASESLASSSRKNRPRCAGHARFLLTAHLHLLIYRVSRDQVLLLRVLHGAQQ
ncbi:type II toxin-antitoxin system RelE/ParE family toxin [Terriglobus saanensis]|uniref:type II toxin-antitoxin system RelE/ParE family toxin n=1 Tax=Terriglobus saanensis TaxID=870903 RepID=UPI0002D575DC